MGAEGFTPARSKLLLHTYKKIERTKKKKKKQKKKERGEIALPDNMVAVK